MKCKLVYILFILAIVACNSRNKLNSNEQKLAAQIAAEEKAKQEAEAAEKQNTVAIPNTFPPDFRFQEDRSVDPNHPPVVIDFSGDFDTINLKLSDIAKKVIYVRLKVPDDSLYFAPHMGGEVHFTKDNIILNNNFGIHRFSRNGEYIEQVVNSNVKKRTLSRNLLFGYFNKEAYRGVWSNHVSTAGNHVIYKFSDYPNEKVSLYQYELKPRKQSVILKDNKEAIFDESFTKGEFVASGKEAIRSGTPGLASTQIQTISENCYAGLSGGLASYDSKTMMVTFNKNGDTLCVFSQQDTLDTPITSTVYKTISTFTSCMYKGIYTFRRAFNDTIFRLIPPNRIVPVYVLKQGDKKITDENWYHFKDKVGKLRPGDFFETQNYILFKFRKYQAEGKRTLDGFYVDYQSLYFYFDKKKEKLSLVNITHRSTNSLYVNNEGKYGIENDLDGGFGFWPHYITHEGNLAKVIRPESLKALVNDERFETRSGEKKKLKELVRSLTNNNNERVVMIIE